MNAITKDFTDAIEAQFSKLNKDVADALLQAKTAEAIAFDLEQKMATGGSFGGGEHAETWGEQFTKSSELQAFAEHTHRPARFRMDVKTTVTTASTSGGPLGGQAYRDTINPLPTRPLRVRSLLPVVGISTGSVE